jgi:glycosyltransferase involved in cell wall biosynthesis
MSDLPRGFSKFKLWLGASKCVYLQGIYSSMRRSYQSMAAIMEIEGLKAVVVGRPDNDAVNRLKETYGEHKVSEKLFFTGMIPQKHTYQYIDHCNLSLVFYATCNPNNTYCDPNRLFQTVVSGLPVIVGNNPPMKDFVSKTEVGIALNSDGDRVDEIVSAIKEILSNEKQYTDNIKRNNHMLYWNSQEEIIKNSFEKTL